jgi:hypothetical protein
MKRNKRTMAVTSPKLAPLTEHILSQMAQEGAALRRRLERFYQERALPHPPPEEEKAEDAPEV